MIPSTRINRCSVCQKWALDPLYHPGTIPSGKEAPRLNADGRTRIVSVLDPGPELWLVPG
ncbi:hypothetical protein CHELA41_50740 [Hyphomicrobiales bacterium]|nr:hypothetical protein CHELA41_50740 [Hyphomicrobiales bacterium]